MVKRLKLSGAMLLVALVLLGVGWAVDPGAGPVLLLLSAAAYALAGLLATLGLSVLLFGGIRIAALVSIDLRGERPVFWIGPPLLRVAVGPTWRAGAQRLGRHDLYLTVPWLVRVIVIALVASWVYGLARTAAWGGSAAVWTAAGVFVALYLVQGRWRGSPDPKERDTGR